jgi:hypothetical protein
MPFEDRKEVRYRMAATFSNEAFERVVGAFIG